MAIEIAAVNFASARARTDYVAGQFVYIEGRVTAGDGAQGLFQALPVGSLTDNDNDILVAGSVALVRSRSSVPLPDTEIAAATTLPAAPLMQSYIIKDSATPADYIVTLNPAAPDGSVRYFKVDSAATRRFTIFDSATALKVTNHANVVQDRMTLWAGESLLLRKKAGAWVVEEYGKRAFSGQLRRTSELILTQSAVNNIPFQEVRGCPGFCLDSASGGFAIPRPFSRWRVGFSCVVIGMAAGQNTWALLGRGSATPGAMSQITQTAGLAPSHYASRVFDSSGYTYVMPAPEVNIGTGQNDVKVDYVAGVYECVLDFQEII